MLRGRWPQRGPQPGRGFKGSQQGIDQQFSDALISIAERYQTAALLTVEPDVNRSGYYRWVSPSPTANAIIAFRYGQDVICEIPAVIRPAFQAFPYFQQPAAASPVVPFVYGRNILAAPDAFVATGYQAFPYRYCNFDNTSPVISNVQVVSVDDTGATISWDTNEPSDTQIRYGQTTYSHFTTRDNTLVTFHQQSFPPTDGPGLYLFEVRSRDACGNQGFSTDHQVAIPPYRVVGLTYGQDVLGPSAAWVPPSYQPFPYSQITAAVNPVIPIQVRILAELRDGTFVTFPYFESYSFTDVTAPAPVPGFRYGQAVLLAPEALVPPQYQPFPYSPAPPAPANPVIPQQRGQWLGDAVPTLDVRPGYFQFPYFQLPAPANPNIPTQYGRDILEGPQAFVIAQYLPFPYWQPPPPPDTTLPLFASRRRILVRV